jgi:hypothetical protein
VRATAGSMDGLKVDDHKELLLPRPRVDFGALPIAVAAHSAVRPCRLSKSEREAKTGDEL